MLGLCGILASTALAQAPAGGAGGSSLALPPPPVPASSPVPTVRPVAPKPAAGDTRVKDVAHVSGTNSNPLVGYGIVVGLAGTGDTQSAVSQQMMARMLQALGMNLPPTNLLDPTLVRLRNSAMVTLTAELPAYARQGDAIDVQVSSMSDAKSLEGGILVMSLLKAANGQVYASAQGPVQVANPEVSGIGLGPRNPKPHLTAGFIPRGGLVGRGGSDQLAKTTSITWVLNQPDFDLASRVAASITAYLPGLVAVARDASSVEVSLSAYESQGPTVDVVARMGNVPIQGTESPTTSPVMYDSRAGRLIGGGDVKLRPGTVQSATTRVQVIRGGQVVTVRELLKNLDQLGVSAKERVDLLKSLQRNDMIPTDLTVL